MTREEWRRVRDLFERAIEEQPRDINAWIEREAPGSPQAAAEALSLLRHHTAAGSFLAEPLPERMPSLLEEEPACEPGHVIGPYTIVRELGRGGMGRVYLATDGRLARAVALKALAPRLTHDRAQRERLRREARAAGGLTHPGICAIYALEEYDGELFIAAEFVDGHTLRDEINGRQPPAGEDILRTAREIASALAGAHAKGVTHRDLKPENVMRTADGRLKILDFGLARVDAPSADPSTVHMTQPGLLVGTPGYMAPEQLNGQPIDARVDVFAFGVLLYEYACGRHPFAAGTPLAIAARVLESDAAPIEGLCPELPLPVAAVIERCLRKQPADRFGSAAEIVAALGAGGVAPRRAVIGWWRTHQVIALALYFVASALAWQIKEWHPGAALVIFGVVGVGATIAGIFRGHLLFTERMNPPGLAAEGRRAAPVTLVVDLLIAAALAADAAILSAASPLLAVLTAALGVGVALARLIVEPSTTRAAFRS
jgi:predicted Ser/Thr protein kinase